MQKGRTRSRASARSRGHFVLPIVGLFLASACEREPVGIDSNRDLPGSSATAQHQENRFFPRVTALAAGYGRFLNPAFNTEMHFAFGAIQRGASSNALGTYHFWGRTPEGLVINLHGRVQCMNKDPENPGRAWMGGVITKNRSTHPVFTGETSQVGRDAWFRVVDYGHGFQAPQPDRTTMIFFEPTGGFTRAQEFCDSLLWFDGDRLTNGVLKGSIQVIHSPGHGG